MELINFIEKEISFSDLNQLKKNVLFQNWKNDEVCHTLPKIDQIFQDNWYSEILKQYDT